METIGLSINGKKITCPEGTSLFEAAAANGIHIPSLCYHPDLKPHGACRLCLVEEEKSGRLFASCVTPVSRDMAIQTNTPRVLNHRRNIVRLMMAEHPESCIVCSKGNRCELRQIAADLGVGENQLYPMPNCQSFEELNPFIIRDLTKCILCGRCIRADHDLVCTGAIDYNHRGFSSRPATVHEMPLEHSSCTFCGTCVSICPTGALSPKNEGYVGTPEAESLSVCGFCGIGCSLRMGTLGGRIVEVNPAGLKDTVNRSTLCVRGHFANDFLNAADRLTVPLLKTPRSPGENGESEFSETSWEEAISHVAARFSEIKRTVGPQSIAFIGSAQCSVEENYLFQKIARAVFQSENITSSAHTGGHDALMHLEQKTGGTCRTRRLAELEQSQAIVVVGSDPDHTAPVLSYHIKRAARNGAALIMIDPLPNELSFFAGHWIRPQIEQQPDVSLTALANGLAAALLARDGHDREFVETRTEGFPAYAESLKACDLQEAARLAGVSPSDLENAAALLSGRKTAFVFGHCAFRSTSASFFDAFFNLALLTGGIGSTGAGIYLAAPSNNWMGACDMGALPDWLPGRIPLSDEAGRRLLEKAWKSRISPDPGLNMARLIEAAENGTVKAAYIMGENPLRKLPQPGRAEAALKKLDFLVVQDIVFTRTARLADVILPGAAFAEKAGAFTNMEGRIQHFDPVGPPPGQALADWTILAMLAARMGYPERYDTLEQVKQEIRRLVPLYADLGTHRQGWLRENNFSNGFCFGFSPVQPPEPSPAAPQYPYTGVIGPLHFHAGGGTRTSRSARIRKHHLTGQIEISAQDSQALGLSETSRLRLTSPYGRIERAFRVNERMAPGQVFIPLACSGNDAMNLIDSSAPAATDAPAWELCRLQIEKIETSGEAP